MVCLPLLASRRPALGIPGRPQGTAGTTMPFDRSCDRDTVVVPLSRTLAHPGRGRQEHQLDDTKWRNRTEVECGLVAGAPLLFVLEGSERDRVYSFSPVKREG